MSGVPYAGSIIQVRKRCLKNSDMIREYDVYNKWEAIDNRKGCKLITESIVPVRELCCLKNSDEFANLICIPLTNINKADLSNPTGLAKKGKLQQVGRQSITEKDAN
ncbi:hypothetical protein AVEN_258485-1 [Araneus ventricosus]|uniref:Uncharacterized protein n=1 Tax=Araneus ventricosus TaxID=182803 RepID=A0A4Y2UDU3_ARAVE|nr:hypothetical protein AVEN_258485-1 [Araneus ventricosus]